MFIVSINSQDIYNNLDHDEKDGWLCKWALLHGIKVLDLTTLMILRAFNENYLPPVVFSIRPCLGQEKHNET